MSDSELLNAQVKITADVTELESGMNRAEEKVTSSVHNMEESAHEGGHNISESFKEIGEAMEAYLSVEVLNEFGHKMLETATDMEIMGQKAKIVFGEGLESVKKWAEESSAKMGLTADAAVNLAAKTGDLLIPMGFTREAATKLSIETINLAGALSRWTGGTKSAAEASQALASATLGHTRELQAYGIKISEADIKAVLYAKNQNHLTGELLSQARAQAILAIAYDRSKDAQTAYAQDSDSLYVLQNKIKAAFGELEEKLAKALTPALRVITQAVQEAVKWFSSLPSALQGVVAGVPIVLVALVGLVATIATAKNAATILKETFGDVFGNIRKTVAKAAPEIAAGIGEAIWPITLVIAACAALYLAYRNNFLGIRDFLKPVIETIQRWFGELSYHFQAVASNQEEVGKIIKELWHSLTEFFSEEVRAIGMILSGVGEIFYGAFIEPFVPVFRALESAGKQVGEGLSAIVQSIGRILSPVFNLLSAMGVAVGDLFKSAVAGIGGFLSTAFTGAASTMQAAASAAASHSTSIQDGLKKVETGANDASNAYAKFGTTVVDGYNKVMSLKPIKTELSKPEGAGGATPSYAPDMSGVRNSGITKAPKVPRGKKPPKPKAPKKPVVATAANIRELQQAYDDLHTTYKRLVDTGKVTQQQADAYAIKLRELHDKTTDLNLTHNAHILALAGTAKAYESVVDKAAAATAVTNQHKAALTEQHNVLAKLKSSVKDLSDADLEASIQRMKGLKDELSIQKLKILQAEEDKRLKAEARTATAADNKAISELKANFKDMSDAEIEAAINRVKGLTDTLSHRKLLALQVELDNRQDKEKVAAQKLLQTELTNTDKLIASFSKNAATTNAETAFIGVKATYEKELELAGDNKVKILEIEKNYQVASLAAEKVKIDTATDNALTSLEDSYQKQYDLDVKAGVKTVELTKQYEADKAAIQGKGVAEYTALVVASQKTIDTATQNSVKYLEEENKVILKFNNDAAAYIAKTKTENAALAYQNEVTEAEGSKVKLYEIEKRYSAQLVKVKQDDLDSQKTSALDTLKQTYDAAITKAGDNTELVKKIDTAYQTDRAAEAAYWDGKIADAQIQQDNTTNKLRLAAEAELQKSLSDLRKNVVTNNKDIAKESASYDPNSQESYLEKNLQPSIDLKNRIDVDITAAQEAIAKATTLYNTSQTEADKARVDSLTKTLADLQAQQSAAANLILENTKKFTAEYVQTTADGIAEANLKIAEEQFSLGTITQAQYQKSLKDNLDYWEKVVADSKVGSTEWTKAVGNVVTAQGKLTSDQAKVTADVIKTNKEAATKFVDSLGDLNSQSSMSGNKSVLEAQLAVYKALGDSGADAYKIIDTALKTVIKDGQTWDKFSADSALKLLSLSKEQDTQTLKSLQTEKAGKLALADTVREKAEIELAYSAKLRAAQIQISNDSLADSIRTLENERAVALEKEGLTDTQKKSLNSYYDQKVALAKSATKVEIDGINQVADAADKTNRQTFKQFKDYLFEFLKDISSAIVTAYTGVVDANTKYLSDMSAAKTPQDQTKAGEARNKTVEASNTSAGTSVVSTLASLLGTIFPQFKLLIDALTPLIEKMPGMVKALEKIGSVFIKLLDAIAPIFDYIGNIVSSILDLVMPLIDALVTILKPVMQVLFSLLETIIKPLMIVLKPLIEFVATILTFVYNVIKTVWNAIAGFLNGINILGWKPFDLKLLPELNTGNGVESTPTGAAPMSGTTGGTGSTSRSSTNKTNTIYNTPVVIYVNEATNGQQVARLVEQNMIRVLRNN
ncbi:hypothetical protein Q0M94_19160 (plasmid) [Deinococcus radiomollis]|uniref:hypothetical protein n=1 Tax=Deinococcus radiomollis TaxID=468916 RepID=UPI003891A12D